jgi:hypothetical protein
MPFFEKLQIPTDNLYRFGALFGLLAAIFCLYYVNVLYEKHNEVVTENNFVLAELLTEKKIAEIEINVIETRHEDLLNNHSDISYSFLIKEDTSFSKQYLIEASTDSVEVSIINDVNKLFAEKEQTKAKISAIQQDLESRKSTLMINQTVLWGLFIISLFLCFWGSNRWYFKLQKLLDKKLKQEVDSSSS